MFEIALSERRQIELMMLRQRFRDIFHLRNTKGDKIIITDQIVVKQGNKVIVATKGHIVNLGLIFLLNGLSFGIPTAYITGLCVSWATKTTYMRLGTGAGTTAYNTAGLTTVNATAADSQSGSCTNPSNGVFKINLVATWNAGTLAAIIVTEMGLYLNGCGNKTAMQAFGWNPNDNTFNLGFFSRISEADGDFVHFTVNIAVPLTVTWTLSFTFA